MLSRVADSLYWMSRYLERAEHTARVMGVHLNLMLEHDQESDGSRWPRVLAALGSREKLKGDDFLRRANLCARPDYFFHRVRPRECAGKCASRSVRKCGKRSIDCSTNPSASERRICFDAQPFDLVSAVTQSSHLFARNHRFHHDPRRRLAVHSGGPISSSACNTPRA